MRMSTNVTPLGGFVVGAEPQDYDGRPPFGGARFDHAPKNLHPDRLAMAAYLFFRPWMAGSVEPPQRVSPAVACATIDDARPVWLEWEKVVMYATNVPHGRFAVALNVPGWDHGIPARLALDAELTFSLPRSDQVAGSSRTARSFTTPTNVWLLADSPARAIEVALGSVLIFGEDLNVDRVIIPQTLPPTQSDRLSSLLSVVGIGLEER